MIRGDNCKRDPFINRPGLVVATVTGVRVRIRPQSFLFQDVIHYRAVRSAKRNLFIDNIIYARANHSYARTPVWLHDES